MPYKNPEAHSAQIVRKPAPDPISDQEPTWKPILGWAIGIGVVLLVAIGGINLPTLPSRLSQPQPLE